MTFFCNTDEKTKRQIQKQTRRHTYMHAYIYPWNHACIRPSLSPLASIHPSIHPPTNSLTHPSSKPSNQHPRHRETRKDLQTVYLEYIWYVHDSAKVYIHELKQAVLVVLDMSLFYATGAFPVYFSNIKYPSKLLSILNKQLSNRRPFYYTVHFSLSHAAN